MLIEFHNPFVFWTSVKNHAEIKDILVKNIKKTVNNPSAIHNHNEFTVTSYYNQTYDYFTDEMLKNIIWDPLEQMHIEKNITTPKSYTLDGLWWNYYYPGGFAKVHSHAPSDWSGVYIVHLEEPNSTNFYAHYGSAPNSGYMNQQQKMDMVNEGDVMIFPSFLEHSFDPCTKDRIIFAFDVVSNYDRPRVNIIKNKNKDMSSLFF
jgi:hypothetical protein